MRRIMLAVGLVAIFASGCSSEKKETGPVTKQNWKPEPPKEPTLGEKLIAIDDIAEAIKLAKPMMSDTTNDTSPGALAFSVWAAKKMKWDDLKGLPMTKYKLIMKDPDEERGKKICAKGRIIEIHAEKTAVGKIYSGGLMRGYSQIYRWIAVGSTGELVANSYGTICGVVIGRQSYSNSMGGTAHAVFLVGMFLLPENTGE
jgi:hypothetical protein